MKSALFLILSSVLLTSCATLLAPDEKQAANQWSFIDLTLPDYERSVGGTWDNVMPDEGTCYGRKGEAVDPKVCVTLRKIIETIEKDREKLELTEEEGVRCDYNIGRRKTDYKNKSLINSDTYNNALFCAKASARILKEGLPLLTALEPIGKQASYLAPNYVQYLRQEVFQKNIDYADWAEKAIVAYKVLRKDDEKREKAYNAFMQTVGKYGLTVQEAEKIVVRSDMVDDWGLNFGQTIYHIVNSTKMHYSSFSKSSYGGKKKLTFVLKPLAGSGELEIDFVVTDVAVILFGIRSGGTTFSGARAEALLGALVVSI